METKKIEKLTEAQIQLMHEHRNQYIDFVINNYKYEGVNIPQQIQLHSPKYVNDFKADMDWIYQKAGLTAPRFVFETDSYMQEKLMINYLYHYTNMENDSVVSNACRMKDNGNKKDLQKISDKLTSHYDEIKRGSKHFKRFSEHNVPQKVFEQLSRQVSSLETIPLILNKEVENDPNKKLEFVEQGFGLPWNSWMAFYSYFSRINVLKNADFDRYFAFFVNNKIWSIQFFRNWCVFTRLPKRIYRDTQNRLHNLDGSAVEWRTNDKNYFIHGVPFSDESLWERVVTHKISTKEIMTSINNMEQRNAILSVIPPAKLITDMNAQLIDQFTPTKKGAKYMHREHYDKLTHKPIKLYKLDGSKLGLQGQQDVFILFYTDPSTMREYFSYVEPRNATSAVNAMSSKFGLTPEQYLNNLVAES